MGWSKSFRTGTAICTGGGLCIENLSQQAKLWIPGTTAEFCGDCVKKCEDVVPNLGENRPGWFTMTTHRLTLPSSPTSFWAKNKVAVIPHPPYSPDLAPCDFFLFGTLWLLLIWHPVTSSYLAPCDFFLFGTLWLILIWHPATYSYLAPCDLFLFGTLWLLLIWHRVTSSCFLTLRRLMSCIYIYMWSTHSWCF